MIRQVRPNEDHEDDGAAITSRKGTAAIRNDV